MRSQGPADSDKSFERRHIGDLDRSKMGAWRRAAGVMQFARSSRTIVDELTVNNRTYALSSSGETVRLDDAPGRFMTLKSTVGGSVTFANPATSLTVDAGGGNDSILINDFDGGAPFEASVSIVGGEGTDTINFNLDATFAADQSLTATAETINVGAGADLVTSGASSIAFLADNVAIDPSGALASAATVSLAPQSPGRLITLGTASPAGLNLTDEELDRITAGTIQIGDASSGLLRITSPLSPTSSLSLVTGAGMEIDNSVTMAVDKDFSATSTSTTSAIRANMPASNIVTSGSGAISVNAAQGFQPGSGSSLTTEHGGITLLANQAGTAAAGGNPTIRLSAGSITTTGRGNIVVDARGIGEGSTQPAVTAGVTQSLSATNAANEGVIDIRGRDGTLGVEILGAITSNSGAIAIVGTGGTSNNNVHGVHVRAPITANNAASISMTGTGGTSSTANADGILLEHNVSAQDGDMILTGTGGTEVSNAGNRARGVGNLVGRVFSTTGAIHLNGVGGTSPLGADYGVDILSSGNVISAGGPLAFTGVPGTGPNSWGVVLQTGSGQHDAIIGSDSILFNSDSFSRSLNARVVTPGTITFTPTTVGLPISLGTDDVVTGAKRLGLVQNELI